MDTVVIGIDGGEWEVIDPLIESGKLPNLASLINDGIHGELKSITPPVSPPAWTSIETGTNPGKHGIFDFSTFDEQYRRRSINTSDRSATPFWRVMNDHNVSTGLFKVPFTYPPGDVDGFLVTGFPTPDSVNDHVTPESLAEVVGDPALLFEDWDYQDRGDYEGFKENLISVAERQSELLLDVIDGRDEDFVMTVYDGADRLQHFFWKYVDNSHPRYEDDEDLSTAFEEYYQAVDRGIGDLLEQAGPETNVLVISDHGFGKLSDDIYIDEWLDRKGFIARGSGDSLSAVGRDGLGTVIQSSWRAIQQIGLGRTVKSILPESWIATGSHLKNERLRTMQWDESEAFFSTLSGQAIFINLEDRFEQGTVTADEYEETIERLRSSLFELTHPETGEKLITDVVRTDEEFDGWSLSEAPDLIVETAPEFTLKGGRSDELVKPSTQNQNDRSGDHRKSGILIANGPAFEGDEISGASVLDIAPTLLYLCDCPVPESMDGDVLLELFDPDIIEGRAIERTDDYGRSDNGGRRWSEQEENELEDQLSSMGYLD